MWCSNEDEDERSGRAGHLTIIQEDDVLALEHVERFSGVVAKMERRPEADWLVPSRSENAPPVWSRVALTNMRKPPKSTRRPSARSKSELFACSFTHDGSLLRLTQSV